MFASISSDFFKPADHKDDAAILVEPTKFQADQPSKFGTQDIATATVTVFKTQADLDNGTPQVIPGCKITNKALAGRLEPLIGQKLAVTVVQQPSKTPGYQPAWVWREVQGANLNKLGEYVQKRDAALAEALAGDDTPDYLK